jgi:FkbM family methyltransferase
VLVEPLPEVFEQLQQRYVDRPEVHCFNCACSDSNGSKPLFLGRDGSRGMLSTLCEDDNDYWRDVRTSERIVVPVTTLTDLLQRSNAPPDFSVLLVDAEGMDFEVLSGLDFDRFRPRIVLTEEYAWNPRKHLAKYRLLRKRGYCLWRQVGVNTVWVDRRFRDVSPGNRWSSFVPSLRAHARAWLRIEPLKARLRAAVGRG